MSDASFPAFARAVRRCASACLCLLLLAAGAARAQVSEELAEQLMKASGQWQQMVSSTPKLRDQIIKAIRRPGSTADEAAIARVAAAAETAFDLDRMRSVARRTLAESVRKVHVPEVLAWYASAPGRLITQAEEADSAQSQGVEERMQAGVASLQAATVERRQLLLRLVEVTRAAQTNTDVVINLLLAREVSLGRFSPPSERKTDAEWRAAFDEVRPQMQRTMEALSIAASALAYAGLSDETLEAYVAFLSGAAGEHYGDLSQRASEAAMLDALDRLAKQLP